MSPTFHRTRIVPFLLVFSVIGATLVPAAPAGAGTRRYVSLSTAARDVVVDGVTYKMRLITDRDGSWQSLSVGLTRAVDPDGPGVLRSTNSLWWSFYELDGAVRISRDLRTASVVTGDTLQPYGTIDYTFTPTGSGERYCDGHGHAWLRQAGLLKGALTLKTKTRLGVVQLGNVRAVIKTITGDCDGGEEMPTSHCMSPYRAVFAQRTDTVLFGVGYGRQRKARINFGRERALQTDNGNGAMFSSSVVTVVPADQVRLSRDLGSGVIKGAPGTFTRGRARFASTGRLQKYAERCGPGLRNVTAYRGGVLTGNLRTRHDVVGLTFDLTGRKIGGIAERVTLQRR